MKQHPSCGVHRNCPGAGGHTPLLHGPGPTCPIRPAVYCAHTYPQPPQLFGSVRMFVAPPSHTAPPSPASKSGIARTVLCEESGCGVGSGGVDLEHATQARKNTIYVVFIWSRNVPFYNRDPMGKPQ
jgi:hypothetical protein